MATELELREHLEKGVMETTPGTKENEAAVRALDEFNRTNADIKRGEAELRMKQNEMDDRNIDKRDEREFKVEQMRQESELKAEQLKQDKFRGWIDTAVKGLTLVVNTVLCVVIIHNDTTGKPLLSGPGRQITGNLFRWKK